MAPKEYHYDNDYDLITCKLHIVCTCASIRVFSAFYLDLANI